MSSSSSLTRPQQSLRLKLRMQRLSSSSSSPKNAPTNTWLILFILLFCTDYGHATPLRRAAFNFHESRQVKTNNQKNAGAGGHAVAEEKIPGKLIPPPIANGDHQGFAAVGIETGGLKKAPFPNADRNVSTARIAVGETPVHYSILSTAFLSSSSVIGANDVATTASTVVVTGLGKTSLNTSVLSTSSKKTETARIVPPALASSHTRVESASSSRALSIDRTTVSTSLAPPASRYNVTSGFSFPTSTPVVVPTHSVSRVLDHARLFPTRALNSSTILSSTSAQKTSSTIPSPITTGFGPLNSTKTVPAPMRHGILAPSSSNSSSLLPSMTRSTSHSTDTTSSSSGPMTTQSSSVGSKSSTATSRSHDGTTTSSRASKSRAERTSSHPSPSKSLKTTEHGSKMHQALKATNTEKSTSSKGIAPIPTAAHHHHDLMSKKTETLVGAIVGSILSIPIVPLVTYYSVRSFWNLIVHGHHPFDGSHWRSKENLFEVVKQQTKEEVKQQTKEKASGVGREERLTEQEDRKLTKMINSFRPPGAPPMHGLTAANLRYLIELHPSELAPPKGREDWFRRGRVDAPEEGSSADLPGGAELVVQPNQAVEMPEGGYEMEYDEDGTFVPLMSGAIPREPITGGPVENPGEEFREAGKKVVVKLSEKEETAKFRTPQKMRILPASILKVRPPGDKPLKVICQKIDNFFEKSDNWLDEPLAMVLNPFRKADKGIYAHDKNDYHTKRSDPDIDVPRRVRRHSRVRRDQMPMIQFVEWDENHDGQPPAPVGPKPPTTVHEYVALLFKYRAELEAQNLLEAQNYTASLLEAAKKKFLIEQAAKLFVESLQKAEAKKKAEADKKAKAEQDARDKAAAEKKAEQDARDKAAAEKKAKEEEEAKEKAEAERKRKQQQEEERKRKQEEDRRARQEYEERKRRQEAERKRKQEEEDRRRRQEEEDRRKEEEKKRKVLEEWQRRHWEKEQERRMAEKCKLNGFNWVFGHIGKWLHACHGPECYCW